ncbi:MAG: hypothetical protein U0Q11_13620 [Vicinamibacterales bacterium]
MSHRLAFYISGHGFGHAARDIEIVNALASRVPVEIILRTDVPDWFLRESLHLPVMRVPGTVDTGMVQPDGISLDEDASARSAASFYADFTARVSREAEFIRRTGAQLVVGDIPPLAGAAAHLAGVPSVAVGNFTWDWIYAGYPQFESLAPGVLDCIAEGYRLTTLALRLPFCGGFTTMPRVEDAPLIARVARLTRVETRRRLGLDSTRTIVLASFGGHRGQVLLGDGKAADTAMVVVVGDESGADAASSSLRVLSGSRLADAGVSYTDLLAASDVVLSKVGYGIVADCIANQIPLLYTHRGRFVEQDLFDRDLHGVLKCRYVDPSAIREGTWGAALSALLTQPAPHQTMAVDGAAVVAQRILEMLRDSEGPGRRAPYAGVML